MKGNLQILTQHKIQHKIIILKSQLLRQDKKLENNIYMGKTDKIKQNKPNKLT
jgi:hypothetical protein